MFTKENGNNQSLVVDLLLSTTFPQKSCKELKISYQANMFHIQEDKFYDDMGINT